jgi:hypothetical protein
VSKREQIIPGGEDTNSDYYIVPPERLADFVVKSALAPERQVQHNTIVGLKDMLTFTSHSSRFTKGIGGRAWRLLAYQAAINEFDGNPIKSLDPDTTPPRFPLRYEEFVSPESIVREARKREKRIFADKLDKLQLQSLKEWITLILERATAMSMQEAIDSVVHNTSTQVNINPTIVRFLKAFVEEKLCEPI